MIDIPTIDELRAARGRSAEQAGLDSQRYATLIQDLGPERAATYVSRPLSWSSPTLVALRGSLCWARVSGHPKGRRPSDRPKVSFLRSVL